MVKVVMAGGGTAGHVNPLLATARSCARVELRLLSWGRRLVWRRIWFPPQDSRS